MMQKKQFRLLITDLNHEGYGVGRYEGLTVFVPFALVGETVWCEEEKVNPHFAYARLIKIEEASPYRTMPICKLFGICGGCELMHLAYEQQLAFKKKMTENTFLRIGKIGLQVDEVIGMDSPYYYRNKIQVPYTTNKKGKTYCGYYRKKSHDIVAFDQCFIQPEYVTDLILFIRNVANELQITGYDEKSKKGCLRHVLVRSNYLDQLLIVLVTNERLTKEEVLVAKIIQRYPQTLGIIENHNTTHTNIILGKKDRILFGSRVFLDRLLDMDFLLSYDSFFQVNREQTEKLYQRVLEYAQVKATDVIVDAYCGVGTMALLFAKYAKFIYGIEVVDKAIDNAKQNAELNAIKNVEFIVGRVEDKLTNLLSPPPSLIIVDPPRKGVDQSVLEAIITANIKKMVYVSCDVATLARDCQILSSFYEIKKLTVIDMFPQTANVECVVLLEKK